MKNTGALLKSKRESSNLAVSEVALATKINPKILVAIEEGNSSALPAKTILKGFVRSYAVFLKMDVDQVMRSFQEETGGPPPSVAVVEPPKPTRGESSSGSSRRRVNDESSSGLRTFAVVVIVVLIGLIIGVRELIEKYQRERVVEASADLNNATPVVAAPEASKAEVEVAPAAGVVAPTSDVAPDTGDEVKLDSPTVEVKPAEVVAEKPAEAVAKPVEKPKVVATTRPIMMSSRVDLIRMPITNLVELRPTELSPPRPVEVQSNPPAATAKPVEVAKPAEVTKAPEPEPVKPPETPAPATEPAIVKAARNEIILEALDKVEVKFQVKGETKRVSLGPSQVHTIHAELPMTLDLSDGGAVNIILNGRERGVPGDLGKPKTIKIP